jgi:signal transduction histidine kinase
MPSGKFQKRLQSLFADIKDMAANAQPDVAVLRRDLESLRAQVNDLESQLMQAREPVESPKAWSPASLIYEKEQIGYTYSAEQAELIQDLAISGLDVNRALMTPLIETDSPIGAVLVEAPPERNWSPDDAELAESIAKQVSLRIQSLRLLAATERARAEAQEATRRFTHERWESFLDAIQQAERIGYTYNQKGVAPFSEPVPHDSNFCESVSVLDEHIGQVYLQSDPGKPLTDDDRALVAAVARQLGQQVENLRLLADASRARAEAEEATRRLTRSSWKNYAEAKGDAPLAFLYDSNRVTPLHEEPAAVDAAHPLLVRGEPIGQLAVSGLEAMTPEASSILAAIAAQASVHLEALRLTEELQKRAEELQELDRLKSAFLANMSHELRTPLNSILGFSDVILEGIDGPLTENMENDLRLIQKNGQHLLNLINDVLDMAKIESGKMNLHPEKFKLYEVLDDVMRITSSLATNKGLPVVIEEQADTQLEINADRTRIRQVMINLVNNAIKFTDEGKVAVNISKLDGEFALVTVSDTGLGIPADQLEQIFLEFTQVDTSTTRKVGGTGLGLPISRRLIEMHGGKLWAESTGIHGEGAIFYVKLPIDSQISEENKQEKVQK